MNLMSKFDFLVDVQHFDAQNSIRCEKKCSLQLFGARATVRNIFKKRTNEIYFNITIS